MMRHCMYASKVNDVVTEIIQETLWDNYIPQVTTYFDDADKNNIRMFIRDGSQYNRKKVTCKLKNIFKLNGIKYRYYKGPYSNQFIISANVLQQFITLYRLGGIKLKEELKQ